MSRPLPPPGLFPLVSPLRQQLVPQRTMMDQAIQEAQAREAYGVRPNADPFAGDTGYVPRPMAPADATDLLRLHLNTQPAGPEMHARGPERYIPEAPELPQGMMQLAPPPQEAQISPQSPLQQLQGLGMNTEVGRRL